MLQSCDPSECVPPYNLESPGLLPLLSAHLLLVSRSFLPLFCDSFLSDRDQIAVLALCSRPVVIHSEGKDLSFAQPVFF